MPRNSSLGLGLKLFPDGNLAVVVGPSGQEDFIMLNGIRVLIVEDEPLVAATLSDVVEDAEGEVVGVARSVSEARQMIRRLSFDTAVLDLNLSDGAVTPVLEALQARRSPTVVYSGGDLPARVRERHPELVTLRKPALPGRLVAEILRARRKGI
jgi:DNA-binding response OmpR family regulator